MEPCVTFLPAVSAQDAQPTGAEELAKASCGHLVVLENRPAFSGSPA
jgi:hypothetical protein